MHSPKADLVLKNGNIYLGSEAGFARAVAVWCNRVLAAGSTDDLEPLIGPDTKVLDLRGRAAIPGFNDGHQHMLSYGLEQLEVSLHPSEVASLEGLKQRIRDKADSLAPGEWVIARRYDHFHLDVGRHPFREELDEVAPRNPVWITRTCGHMGVANSLALAQARIDETTPSPEGGLIEQQNGRLTGLLQETAQGLLKSSLPRASQGALIDALETAGNIFLAHGITSVMDAGVGLRQQFEDLLAYFEARRQRRLKVRSYLAMLGGTHGIQERAMDAGLLTGQGDEFLKIGSIKLFTDGSAGGKTAAMTLPYVCSCDNKGLLVYRDDELEHWVAHYHGLGYQVSIHAIGDAAIDQSLRAVDRAHALVPSRGRRHRIEHCGFTSPAQIAAMQRLGMIPAPQPIFLYEFGELYVDVLGEARPSDSYPMRSWTDAGLHPIASSDTPVCDFNPMKNLYAMVTRKTDRGRVLGAHERLSLPEAVTAATAFGAYGSFSEDVKGTLEPGRLADIAVFDRDVFSRDPEELLETQVDVTVLDGEVAHDRHAELVS